jgi:hypothetical protein
MRAFASVLAILLAGFASPLRADDPPDIEHQPLPCTLFNRPISLCATVTDDANVAKSRIYFRPAGEEFYSFVDMVFGGINYCGTLPAPREGALKVIEYYIQAVDDQYQAKRTSTFQMNVQAEGVCEFPPLERDASKAASITVHATNKKQGKKVHDAFANPGVNFVPIVVR